MKNPAGSTDSQAVLVSSRPEAGGSAAPLAGPGPGTPAHALSRVIRIVLAEDHPLMVEAVLSERERDVLELVARGLSNRQIAARLSISVQTVKTHVRNLCRKLEVSSRAAAVRRATQRGLL